MNLTNFRESIEGGDERLLRGVRELRPEVKSLLQAQAWVKLLVDHLLNSGRYGAAAELLWGRRRFDARPGSVKRIWRAINRHHKLILLGGAAVGKSYCSIVWMLLDWLRDPEGTNIKVVSTSEGHAKSNVFSTMTDLYRTAIIPMPGVQIDKFIGIDSKERDKGISLVSIPAGESGKGRMRGFHPKPRDIPHPTLGPMTRVRGMYDEAEEIPEGIWTDTDNLLANMDETGTIKIICAANPKNPLSQLAELAAPVKGWSEVDMHLDQEWESKERWQVVRIDPARTENVVQREVIYSGLMSYEGFENLRLKNGGNSQEYFCFGRGMYYRQGAARSLIPISLLDSARGTFVFTSTSTNAGSVDLAFEGGDDVCFASGHYGLATGYQPAGKTKIEVFKDPVYCLQVDAVYELPNLLTLAQIGQLRRECTKLTIPGTWFTCDRTGNGTGVHDGLRESWDPGVRGINWSEAASDTKILEEDKYTAYDEYDGIVSEMYFAVRRWLEFKFLLFAPHVNTSRVFSEFSKREYSMSSRGPNGMGRMKVESKKDFKLGNRGISPDASDAVAMLLHGCRMNSRQRSAIPGLTRAAERRVAPKQAPSPWDVSYVDMMSD